MFMITSRVGLLGACFVVCFLICSITPISALEMGSMEDNTITSSFADVETLDNLTSSELGGLYYLNQIHRPNDPPNKKIVYVAVTTICGLMAVTVHSFSSFPYDYALPCSIVFSCWVIFCVLFYAWCFHNYNPPHIPHN